MKHLKSLACTLALSPLLCSASADSPALLRLLDGNTRYLTGAPTHSHQDAQRRAEVAEGQKPFAVVIGCADSRTAPEILFDQGLGDIFVVRLAGNVVDDVALASVEFAVKSLGARLIVVLGHEKCGAVQATIGAMKSGAKPEGHLGTLIDAIRPAVLASQGQTGDALENAIRENVAEAAAKLRTASPLLQPLITSGELEIVGARYDLHDGKVTTLP